MEVQTPRPLKKSRLELAVVIQAPKKPEVYLKVKRNYSFYVWMVRRQEVEERTAEALERLMRWIEVMDSESDGEESERSEFREREE